MKSRNRGDLSHHVPKVMRDPGVYLRGEVTNAGQGTPTPQPGEEWAGNSPGWQGMPKPLGSAPGGWAGDLGEPNGEQMQLSGKGPIFPTIKGSK